MTRIACLMTGDAQGQLLRPWLLYHGYLFGFENLHVCGPGRSSESTLTLIEFAALGVNVEQHAVPAEDDDFPVGVSSAKIAAWKSANLYDVVIPLDVSDFLAINGVDGITCERTQILGEVATIERDGVGCRAGFCLENWPGYFDLFDYVPCSGSIIVVRADPDIDQDTRAGVRGRTDLLWIRFPNRTIHSLRASRPRQPADAITADRVAGEGPLVRFRGLKRFLEAVLQPAASRRLWNAGPDERPSAKLELDLDSFPYTTRDYQSANPELIGADYDLFEHFLRAGYEEGRRLKASRSGMEEVAARMAAMREIRRDGTAGYAGLAHCMASLERADEGEEILRLGIEEFGHTAPLLRERALLAMFRQDHSETVRRWERFRDLYPDDMDGYDFGSMACHQAANLEEAERIVLAGLERFPGDVRLRLRRIDVAIGHRNWPLVKALWDELVRTHADRQEVKDRAGSITFLIRSWQLDHLENPSIEPMDGPVVVEMSERETLEAMRFLQCADTAELRSFFQQFESLGHSCEFGLVQRRYGAEPIGLLRWNSIHTLRLILALESEFVGIDDPDNLVFRNIRGEFVLTDRTYATAMHTFIYEGDVDADILLTKQTKRMAFLRRKLIEDLEANEKLFVHLDDASLSADEIDRLRRAFQRYGNGCLLYVRIATVPSQTGRIELAGDGLILGYIERPGRGPDGIWNIDFASWLKLCGAAHAVWQSMNVSG